jgi:hypothetical protein
MIKKALVLLFLLSVAAPLFAQTSEFGLLVGGGNRRATTDDKTAGVADTDFWKFDDTVKEAYLAIQIEPGVRFKMKVGQMDTTAVFVTDKDKEKENPGTGREHFDGRLEHIDGVMDYRFSEPYGSTGLFAGLGLYRQTGGGHSENNFGFSGGVNADFPLNPRYGIVVEATYHYVPFDAKSHYITGTAGLRINF